MIFLIQEEPWKETDRLVRQLHEVAKASVSLFFFLSPPLLVYGFLSSGLKVTAPPPDNVCALKIGDRGESNGNSLCQWNLPLFLFLASPSRLYLLLAGIHHTTTLTTRNLRGVFRAHALPEQIMALFVKKKGERKLTVTNLCSTGQPIRNRETELCYGLRTYLSVGMTNRNTERNV